MTYTYRDIKEDCKVKYTYLELKECVDHFYKNLSDDGKYRKLIYNDVTLEEYVLSSMNCGDEAFIDFESCRYEIIPKLEVRNKKITELIK